MLTFLIKNLITTFAAIGVLTTLLVIVTVITKDTLEIPPKQYALQVMWIFLAVMAIQGLILAYHQHN